MEAQPSNPSPESSAPQLAASADGAIIPHRFDARGVLPPKSGADPWAHRRGEPRTFVAAWIVLLTILVIVTLGGVGVLGLLSHDVYRPAARRLFVLIMLSICMLWPLVRASQTRPAHPARAFASDACFLVLPIPVLIAAQAFPWMAGWPVSVCVCLAACFAVWCLLIGALLAIGRAAYGLLVVAAALVLTIAGPIVEAFAPIDDQGNSWVVLKMLFPLSAVREIVLDRAWSGRTAFVTTSHWVGVAIVGVVAIAAWALALFLARRPTAPSQDLGDYHPLPR